MVSGFEKHKAELKTVLIDKSYPADSINNLTDTELFILGELWRKKLNRIYKDIFVSVNACYIGHILALSAKGFITHNFDEITRRFICRLPEAQESEAA